MTIQTQQMSRRLENPTGEYEKFLYSVSHDLQEPLRMVTSFLKLLEHRAGDALDPESKQYLQYGVENAERMKKMIYALVDLSRVGRDGEESVVIDLSALLGELVRMYTSGRETEAIEVNAECGRSPVMASGLAVRLLRVLFENAVENRSERPLQISLTCEPVENGFARFHFADNGKGIAEVYHDKVFEIFKKTKESSERTGAGLAIAKAIVTKYGGSIQLDSSVGKGTVVSFTLPTNE